MIKPVHIVGGGLAGCEAAWVIARKGIPVVLHEMRPDKRSAAHKTDGLAELVCSNSFRSDNAEGSAIGSLHAELRLLGSLILEAGDACRIPAGDALAVDRDSFSLYVEDKIHSHPLISVERTEICCVPPVEWGSSIIATGPLTSAALADSIRTLTDEDALAFYDAIAPVVMHESINMDIAWAQSRYDRVGILDGDGRDYINCPMTELEYNTFIDALLAADQKSHHEWEAPFFEGCLPIEVMAERGRNTLRFGPMKPVGLTNPHTNEKAHAVVQLRQDNALGTLYNIVGFQTRLKWSEQTQIFRMIPGLEAAAFARLGGIHRNTFINSPKLLDNFLRLKTASHIRFAGQITGCEGYIESAAVGFVAGLYTAQERIGLPFTPPPFDTALGSLLAHITSGADERTYQPMNINFGLFPPLPCPPGRRKPPGGKERKRLYCERALTAMIPWAEETLKKQSYTL